MTDYLLRHLQVLVTTLGQLFHHPGATLMTALAIGITLALPSLLYLFTINVERASDGFTAGAPVSLFLEQEATPVQGEALTQQLAQRDGIARARFISAEQALADFKRRSGLQEALELLQNNPLPHTIVLYLEPTWQQSDALTRLLAQLAAEPLVEVAQSDVQWLTRLRALLSLVQRGVVMLAVLLAVAVVVIVSNTIRLAILNRREEIEIIKLIGGTDRFVRRPFLYSGLLQGLLGALVALILIGSCIALLRGPIGGLARLYDSEFEVIGLGAADALWVLLLGAALGWVASRWSVARYLSRLEPR